MKTFIFETSSEVQVFLRGRGMRIEDGVIVDIETEDSTGARIETCMHEDFGGYVYVIKMPE